MSNRPRYQQIKSFILEGIKQQKYQPGDKIPTEAELTRQFEVSRMTVNKAIRDLVQENMLVRYPGLGTFVSDAKAESPLAEIRNIAEEVRQRGHNYSCQVIELSESVASETMSMQMGVPIGTKQYHSVIVHKENDLPIQLEDRYIIASLVPGYIDQDFSKGTPNEYLSKVCPISSVEHIVEAVLPSAVAQDLLGIDANAPCIQVSRRTWSDGRLISFACLTHPGSRYKLRSITMLGG
ncbi:histidine utilization repressor [Motiliproteus sp. MSK22-1]|uniref:histidine utilization repressor n=1 Tax=Motiliproteus sp. MSK22-1 TaxID=1897630 RepID=UPI000976401F|nr:histidine utilization repressor [Motiliproteus sp. MSK22-1]OMH32783.1 histidine utilization repressor [Motiliproteus sp. MSK22-1]